MKANKQSDPQTGSLLPSGERKKRLPHRQKQGLCIRKMRDMLRTPPLNGGVKLVIGVLHDIDRTL